MSKVFFITGAGRGLGVDVARQALENGHQVVATGRRPDTVLKALGGEHDNLLVAALDLTDPATADAAVTAAVDRFGRIDVLVNNAANFYAGYFEVVSDQQMRQQIETNVFGPMNVTRAVLPVMRKQRAGHIMTISSLAGLVGQEFTAAYTTSKFAVEGWMEALHLDVAPFGIRTTTVEPGFFRTELLVEASTTWPELTVDDYAENTAAQIAGWKTMNGQQAGAPAKLAEVLLKIAGQAEPPVRFVAGADAIASIEAHAKELLAQVDASRALGMDLAHDDGPA